MSAMIPIVKRPTTATRVPPRVHPSWSGERPRVAAKLDASGLRRLWDAVDGE